MGLEKCRKGPLDSVAFIARAPAAPKLAGWSNPLIMIRFLWGCSRRIGHRNGVVDSQRASAESAAATGVFHLSKLPIGWATTRRLTHRTRTPEWLEGYW